MRPTRLDYSEKCYPGKKHSSLFCQRVIDEEKKEGFITFKPDLADEWAFDAVNQKCLKATDQLKNQRLLLYFMGFSREH